MKFYIFTVSEKLREASIRYEAVDNIKWLLMFAILLLLHD